MKGASRRNASRTPVVDGARLFVESDTSIPLVDVEVAFRGGSAYDPPGREGLARCYARLIRRGTSRRSPVGALGSDAFDEALERLGGSLTIDVSPSVVRVHGSVIRRNLEPFVHLLGAMLQAPAMRPKDLAFVRREARAELVAQLDADRWLGARALRHFLFQGHPYGRSSQGSASTLASIRMADVQAFHDRFVRADNAVVGFAGHVDHDEARALLPCLVGGLAVGAAPLEPVADPVTPAGLRVVVVDKPDRTQTQLFIGAVGVRLGERDFYPLLVANTCFGGTFSARLVTEVRVRRGWSYGVQSRVFADRARDAWVVHTHPAVEHVRDCLALELDMIREFVGCGVRPAEVAFARAYLTKSHAFDRDTPAKRVEPRIEAALFGLSLAFFEEYRRRVDAVDARAASAAVARRLGGPRKRGDDLVVAVVGPAARLERALGSIDGVESVEVVSYDAVPNL